MISRNAAQTIVGVLGNVISFVLFLSPVPTFIGIWKKGSVEEYSAIPYLATLANCCLWGLYGLPMVSPHSLLLVTVNATGVAMESLYLFLFLLYSQPKKRMKVMLIMLALFVSVAFLTLLVLALVHSIKLRSIIMGTTCVLANIAMYASPLSVMKLVITTKSVEYMPLFLSLASLASGICWTCYAIVRFDPFIAAPNGLGTLFGVAQLVLYAAFYKSRKQQTAERQGKGEMGLAQNSIKLNVLPGNAYFSQVPAET